MKKSLLSMAALALIMASCSNDEENVTVGNGANAVPVNISQKVAGVETKAAIIPGSPMKAVILMVDEGSDGGTGNPNFNAFVPRTTNELNAQNKFEDNSKRANVATAQFEASLEAKEIALNPTLYYPIEVATAFKKAWIFGVSPQGAVSGTTVAFNEKDGLQDVMYTGQQAAGNSNSPENNITLNFEHKTTQLTFVAKLSGALTGSEWAGKNVSVKNIIIQNAQVPASLNISDGRITWTDGANLTVAGCNTALTTTACAPSVPVMVKPASDILVNIELSVGGTILTYNNLPIKKGSTTENLSTQEGYSHEITFSITAPVEAQGATKITTSAKIVDWKIGDAGTVEIK